MIVEVSQLFFNKRIDAWDINGTQTIRTENVHHIETLGYSENLEMYVYEVVFYGGAVRYTGPNGKNIIMRYMR